MLDVVVALQAWRRAVLSAPYTVTGSWSRPDACAYHSGFSAPSPQDPDVAVVASVDLNHADLGGCTTMELLQTEGHLPHLSAPYLLAELAATSSRWLSYDRECFVAWRSSSSRSLLLLRLFPASSPIHRPRGVRHQVTTMLGTPLRQ